MSFFTPAELARFQAGKIRCALMAELHFASRVIGVWNGNRKLRTNGVDFLPCKGAGQVEGLNFAGGVTAETVTLSVPVTQDSELGLVLEDTPEVEQRLMKLYLQSFDDGWQPIAAPPIIFFGYMQPPRVSRTQVRPGDTDGPTLSASVACENIFFNAGLPSGGRNTDRDQQLRFEGDRVFQFTASLRNKVLTYPDFSS